VKLRIVWVAAKVEANPVAKAEVSLVAKPIAEAIREMSEIAVVSLDNPDKAANLDKAEARANKSQLIFHLHENKIDNSSRVVYLLFLYSAFVSPPGETVR
jgi:hypothetical protein